MTLPNAVDLFNAMKLATAPPAALGKPARDLTQQEARDVVVYYALNGLLHFDKAVTLDKDGKVTHPKVGDKLKLGFDIGGIQWVLNRDSNAHGLTSTGPMDLRMAALAVRFAQFLKAGRWGVTQIFWGGMGYGRDANDRHGQGLAMDFHGALTRFGEIDVQRDWGSQPITLPSGKVVHVWPASQQPYFRLDIDTNAGGFFYDVYHWLTGEARDGFGAKQTSIGDHSAIYCPDQGDVRLRDQHQNHIHCEIAPA